MVGKLGEPGAGLTPVCNRVEGPKRPNGPLGGLPLDSCLAQRKSLLTVETFIVHPGTQETKAGE